MLICKLIRPAAAIGVIATLNFSAPASHAVEVNLQNGGATLTTGDNLDGISNIATPVAVVEIPGLIVTASTGAATETLNSLSGSFGVDTDGSGDDSDRTEGTESFFFSFNQMISITEINFIGLGSTAEFIITVGGTPISIIEADLSDAGADIYTPMGADAALLSNMTAGTTLGFSVNSGVVGIQTLEIVIPEPATLMLIGLGSLALLARRRA